MHRGWIYPWHPMPPSWRSTVLRPGRCLMRRSGRPLHILTDAVAADTAVGWEAYRDMALAHFDDLKSELDRDNPSWRD